MKLRPALLAIVVATACFGYQTTARAGVPWAPNCAVLYNTLDDLSMALTILPDGSGRGLTYARAVGNHNGEMVDASMMIVIKDSFGSWVTNYPATDIWLEAAQGGVAFCPSGPAIADFNTTNVTWTPLPCSTTFSGPFHGGGHTNPANGDQIVVMTASTGAAPLPVVGNRNLQFNSADIDGNLWVNLSDVAIFVGDFLGAYNFRSDLLPDNVVNISDIPVLAGSLGVVCH